MNLYERNHPSARPTSGPRRLAMAFRRWVAFALLCGALGGVAAAASVNPPDTELIRRGNVIITQADLDEDMKRLPEQHHGAFLSNEQAVLSVLQRMLDVRDLTQRARSANFPVGPAVKELPPLDQERAISALWLTEIEEQAGRRFDAQVASYEARARELYLINREAYKTETGIRPYDEVKGEILKRLRSAEVSRARSAVYEDMHSKANVVTVNESALRALKPALPPAPPGPLPAPTAATPSSKP
jgi:hypothetical protein